MDDGGPWRVIFVIAAVVTAILGAIVVTVVGVIALGVGRARRRRGL